MSQICLRNNALQIYKDGCDIPVNEGDLFCPCGCCSDLKMDIATTRDSIIIISSALLDFMAGWKVGLSIEFVVEPVEQIVTVNYSCGLPLGNMKDFIIDLEELGFDVQWDLVKVTFTERSD